MEPKDGNHVLEFSCGCRRRACCLPPAKKANMPGRMEAAIWGMTLVSFHETGSGANSIVAEIGSSHWGSASWTQAVGSSEKQVTGGLSGADYGVATSFLI